MESLIDLLFLLMYWLGIYWKVTPRGWLNQTQRVRIVCHGEEHHFAPLKTPGCGLG